MPSSPTVNPELLSRADQAGLIAKQALLPAPVAPRTTSFWSPRTTHDTATFLSPASYIRSTIQPLTPADSTTPLSGQYCSSSDTITTSPSEDSFHCLSPIMSEHGQKRQDSSSAAPSPTKSPRFEDPDKMRDGDESMNSDPNSSANTGESFNTYSHRKTTSESSQTPSTPGGSQDAGGAQKASRLVDPQLEKDMDKVRQAVQSAGGLIGQHPPDFAKIKARDGEKLEVIQEWYNFEDEEFEDVPVRPLKTRCGKSLRMNSYHHRQIKLFSWTLFWTARNTLLSRINGLSSWYLGAPPLTRTPHGTSLRKIYYETCTVR